MPKGKKRKTKEQIAADNTLKDMVGALNELPTDVLQQLLDNLNEIEKYNKEHPEELEKDWKEADKEFEENKKA